MIQPPCAALAAAVGDHHRPAGAELVRLARINGSPGAILKTADGRSTIAFELDGEGCIGAIYGVRNPEKLRGLEADAGGARSA